jgi:ubiquinone biosynthesis monooxygenase Coq7
MTTKRKPAKATAQRRAVLPGDRTLEQKLHRIIRVDQAGEYGAKRIYEGQLAVLGKSDYAPTLQHMLEQELVHLDTFNKLMVEHKVRPTALHPFWHVAGWALGAGTALLSPHAAMACTVAVEDAINDHYAAQKDEIGEDLPALANVIEQFRLEELEHRNTGLEHGAEQAVAYKLLYTTINKTCKLAIKVAERI